MGLLNLALGQLLGLFLPLAALLVALYFYDRSRRRVLVSTLRFWPKRPAPPVRQRHKRIQHPLSLLLQLVALLLLLLAVADPRPDMDGPAPQQRVILLDTSAAMALSDEDGAGLMQQAKALAISYLDAVPNRDRLLLVEADGAPRVRVPFTTDRGLLRQAILAAEPSRTALDLDAAFELAAGTLRLALNAEGEAGDLPPGAGETVYIGPGRAVGQPTGGAPALRLRVLETGTPRDSVGLLALRAAADPAERGKWDIELEARSYGTADTDVPVEFFFDGKRLGHRTLAIPPGGDASLRFTLRTEGRGELSAKAADEDAYAPNNEASVRIPGSRRTPLQVVGAAEEAFRPLLATGPQLEPVFVASPEDLTDGAIHVWADGSADTPSRRAIYLAPPEAASPVAEAARVSRRVIREWSASHPLARGVRDVDFAPSRARVFTADAGYEFVAGTAEGPVILARAADDKRFVVFGFDLADASVRGRLASPLLFANAVAWLDAGAFRPATVEARPPGAVAVEAPHSALEQIRVSTTGESAVPWVLADGAVRFYAHEPGTYRVTTAERDVTLHLTQPDVAALEWNPDDALRGLPARTAGGSEPPVLWPWLAGLAALLLLYDWVRFGRGRRLSAEDVRAPAAGEGAA